MFIARHYELKKLHELYEHSTFEFTVIYGRRRVGKSTLINEFIKDKKNIYFMGIEGNVTLNLRGFSQAIYRTVMNETKLPPFEDFEQLFQFLDTISKEHIIVVIDEYPFLAEAYPAISSLIQSHIDQVWKHGNMMLILCGSSMSFMEHQVLGYKSPLYGRRTAQFKIEPFLWWELREFQWKYTEVELAQIYAITGGIGEYLQAIDPNASVKDNILKLYLESSGRMFEEPMNLMKQEMRNPTQYHAVLDAIAQGASTLNEIANQAKEDNSACNYHLKTLIELGIVQKEEPIIGKIRKPIYSIKDSAFVFWYRFVFPSMSMIMQGNGEFIYEHYIEPQFNAFMGLIFERMCLDFMRSAYALSLMPFPYRNIGRWWGTNPKLKRQEEIDVLACEKQHILLGECKWTNVAIDKKVLDDLLAQGDLFSYPNQYFILFAKEQFSTYVTEYAAAHENIRLMTLHDMLHQK